MVDNPRYQAIKANSVTEFNKQLKSVSDIGYVLKSSGNESGLWWAILEYAPQGVGWTVPTQKHV